MYNLQIIEKIKQKQIEIVKLFFDLFICASIIAIIVCIYFVCNSILKILREFYLGDNSATNLVHLLLAIFVFKCMCVRACERIRLCVKRILYSL